MNVTAAPKTGRLRVVLAVAGIAAFALLVVATRPSTGGRTAEGIVVFTGDVYVNFNAGDNQVALNKRLSPDSDEVTEVTDTSTGAPVKAWKWDSGVVNWDGHRSSLSVSRFPGDSSVPLGRGEILLTGYPPFSSGPLEQVKPIQGVFVVAP